MKITITIDDTTYDLPSLESQPPTELEAKERVVPLTIVQPELGGSWIALYVNGDFVCEGPSDDLYNILRLLTNSVDVVSVDSKYGSWASFPPKLENLEVFSE